MFGSAGWGRVGGEGGKAAVLDKVCPKDALFEWQGREK